MGSFKTWSQSRRLPGLKIIKKPVDIVLTVHAEDLKPQKTISLIFLPALPSFNMGKGLTLVKIRFLFVQLMLLTAVLPHCRLSTASIGRRWNSWVVSTSVLLPMLWISLSKSMLDGTGKLQESKNGADSGSHRLLNRWWLHQAGFLLFILPSKHRWGPSAVLTP